MSKLLNARAYRIVMLSVATFMVVSLLAPIVAIASTDLAPGDSAVVSGSEGANLRSDTSLTDETIIADLPAGTTVWVNEGPYYEDTGVWVYVATDGYGPGFITTALLSRIDSDALAEANGVETEEQVVTEEEAEVVPSGYAWLEPIDSLVVVDYNAILTEQGLPVLADAYHGAPVLGYIQVGGGLDVTSARIWQGDANFVRVNFNGVGAFVDGSFVELASEYVEAVPTEEVIWLDKPVEEAPAVDVPAEEVPVEEVPVEEAPAVDVPVEEVPVEEAPVEEAPAVDVPVEEVPVEEAPVAEAAAEEPVTEVVPAEIPATDTVATPDANVSSEPAVEDVVPEVPVTDQAPANNSGTDTVATPSADVSSEPTVEDVVPEEPVTEEAPAPDTDVSNEPMVEVPTDEVAETEVAAEAPTEAVETEEATEAPTEAVETEEATEAPTEVVETEEATEAPTEVVETEEAIEAPAEAAQAPIATTADAFDAEAMIGSATVTGTTSGLLCRTEPSPSAPVLMTLAEGTKTLVSAEPVNGYLGINCGGLQGFGDVNYLWSGGAGDVEITDSRMSIVVTGTGNGLNCRTGAGLNHSVITTLWDGTTLTTRGAASNGWTPVSCGGQNGFVSTTWVEVASGASTDTTATNTSETNAGTAVVNTGGDGLYCRTGAGTSYGIITVLRHGSSVSVRGANQGDWVPVTCGGSAGFAHGAYLDVAASAGTDTDAGSEADAPDSGDTAAIGSVTVANTGGMGLNCRTGTGTSTSIITTLALGQTVQTRSGSTSGWTAVICGGTNGFVSSEFISGASAGTTPTEPESEPAQEEEASTPAQGPVAMSNDDHAEVRSNLNLRYSASLSSSVATTVDSGKVVLITGSVSNDFYPVDYDGLQGFMHKDYLWKTSAALSERGGSGTPEAPAPEAEAPAPEREPVGSKPSPTGNAMVDYAMRYVGYPYVWATRGPASFDCSGFTYWVTLNVTGQNIGAGTWTQVSAGTPVSKANLQPGDLVFFQNTYTAGLSHVGLYIGNGQFIHAQNEATGVVISDLDSSYYGPRWYGAVRL